MPSVQLRRLLALLLTLALLSLSVACGSSDDEADDEDNSNTGTETAAAKYTPNGNEGSIAGTVNFTGAAPAVKPISMDADPYCASSNPNAHIEDVVVNDGKLQNVFVYVKDGKTADGKSIAGFAFDPPAPEATLDQHGCQYHPHVLVMMTTQNFKVTNSIRRRTTSTRRRRATQSGTSRSRRVSRPSSSSSRAPKSSSPSNAISIRG